MTSPPETPGSPINRLIRSLSGKHIPSLAKSSTTPAQDPLPVAEETLETPETVAPETVPEVSPEVPAEDPAPATETSPKAGADKFHPFDRLKAKFRKATLLQSAEALDETPPLPINDGDADDYDDPPTLAERIRALIDSLPSPTPRSSRTIPKFPKATPIPRDENGRPIPPPGAIPIKDQKLIKRLFNPVIMNSENRSGDSIWSILSSIKHDDTEAGPSGDGGHDTDSTHSGGSRAFSDNSSFMMYSPLIPKNDDLVEIADSEVVTAPSTASLQIPIEHAIELPPQVFKWPWSKTAPAAPAGGDKKDGETKPDGTSTPTPTLPPIEHRVWIPSTTKLSCEILWWGYRLYLPPPVLAILSDKQLEATKRAAIITTALTWLFSNLPVSLFPLPMQPALLMFQKLVPYLGYIGTFISWSWSTVKSYDVGYGVILSATWLLPVALLPGTWREANWPGDKKTPPTGTAPSAPSSPAPGPSAPGPSTPVSTAPAAVPTITPGTGVNISHDQGATSVTPNQGSPSAGPSKIERAAPSTTSSKLDKAVETVPEPMEETPATSSPAAPGTDKSSAGGWWKYIKS